MGAHKKQRIFSILVILTMAVILTCVFVACDKTDAQENNYKVTIHPNNGQADIVWDAKSDIPDITYYGYHIVGYYLDEDFTTSTTLESLKATKLTTDLNVYVKWEKDSVPPKTKITTNNLLCDYDTRALSGKVSNSTTVFSFNDEITVEKGTTYTISTDINGINVIPSKTVNLEIGDNIFYVLVSNEDELTLYTATVRRKPIYTVTFDTLGGTEVEAQQVEEDAFATAPTTEKNGCTFDKWDWDFSTPITDNTTITAIWNAFAYNIVYDFNIPADSVSQEVDNSMNPTTYTVDDTIYFAAPTRKGYYLTGWSVSHISKGTTGTITTTAQWRLIPYEIIYDFGDSNSVSKATNNELNPYYYTIENEIAFAEPARAGYTFVSWDKNIEKGTTGAQTITASWDVIQHNISYVLNGWTNAESNKNTYTIEDQKFDLQDGINGESLFCGWYLDGEYTNYIETIDASTMRDYTIYAMPDCGATKGLTIENGVVKTYSGYSSEIIIPSYYNGYDVISIAESSFKNCESITNVVIPNSVTTIESGSFFGCSSLESITIPFIGASRTASKGYDQVFGYIFGYRTYSTDADVVIMDETEQYVEPTSSNGMYKHYGYYISSSLKNIVVKGERTSVPNNAFKNCRKLKTIMLFDGVTDIGTDAFEYCTELMSINVSENNSTYASFDGILCNKSKSSIIHVPKAIQGTIIIPDNVTNIVTSTFESCDELMGINVSESNSTYASFDGVLYDKSKKSIIHVPKAIQGAIIIPDSVTGIRTSAFKGRTELTGVTIGNGVTCIQDSAFCDCTGLTDITIGKGVMEIYSNAFYGCTGITNIAVNNDNKNYHSAGNCLIETKSKTLILGCKRSTIPADGSVTSIGSYAFYNCTGLTSVIIPDSVASIGANAFRGCTGLTSITIPFVGASKTANSGYDQVLGYIFGYTTSFSTVAGTTRQYSSDSEYSYFHYWYYIPSSLKSIVISSGVTAIPAYAFYNCTGLTSVTIPDSVTSIDSYAFCNCASLTSIAIPKVVTSIAWCAFGACANLDTVYYEGDETQWNTISFDSWNDALTSAERYYYSETEPALTADGTAYDGNYWHYDTDGETIVVWKKEN